MPAPLQPPELNDIRAAHDRIRASIVRTPLLRLNVDDAPAEIYLKLENLQPIGSFKLRGAGNAILSADPARLAQGIWTASAGNMAQGVAWHARRLGVPCTVVVPDHAPATKLAALTRLGATIAKLPHAEWWDILLTHQRAGMDGVFIHPVSDPAVIAGNGTIGLEIAEDLPDVTIVLVPFGGGGLSCGIAAALRAVKPSTRVYACEVETGAPLAASFASGTPTRVTYTASFVDGISAPSVLAEMWPLASQLLAGALVMPLTAVADAIRVLIERNRVVAEGAGATSVAAALSGQAGGGKIVCVVSGGNIDPTRLVPILQGSLP